MARLLLVLLAPATYAQLASLDSVGAPIKTPTAEHQSQMKSLLRNMRRPWRYDAL